MAELPKIVDYSKYLTLIRNQDSAGGCGAFATLHALDIQMERVAPYCPDASYAFNSYVYNASMGFGPADPRVTVSNLNQAQVIEQYGSCSEASFPTNFDNPLNPVPSDENFQEAMNYRIVNFSNEPIRPQTTQELKQLLYEKGPLVMAELIDQHVVALIGYNDNTQTVKYVNSWPDWAGGGIQETNYLNVMERFASHGAWVKYLEVVPPGSEALSARIRVSHSQGRKYLTIKLGVVGELPLIVWDRNCQVNWSDDRKDLAIDVPLPAYGPLHWPPSKQHIWYVEVHDNGTTTYASVVGTVQEVTLVKRVTAGPDGSYLEKYSPCMNELVFNIPSGGSTTLYIPFVPLHHPGPIRPLIIRYSCPHLPDCPACPIFDIAPMEEIVSHFRRPVLIEIYREGKLLARLGRINDYLGLEWNTRAPNKMVDRRSLRVLIASDDFEILRTSKTIECELRITDPGDQRVLQSHVLVLTAK